MIEAFGDFIRNIAVFLIFAAFVEMVMPNNDFKKYINIVIGLLMMIVVLRPVGNLLFRSQEPLELLVFTRGIEMDKKALERQSAAYEQKQKELILQSYKEQLYKQIRLLISKNFAMEVVEIEVGVNENPEDEYFAALESIKVTVAQEEKGVKGIQPIKKVVIGETEEAERDQGVDLETLVLEKNLKNLLTGFYNLSSDNIYITVQKKK